MVNEAIVAALAWLLYKSGKGGGGKAKGTTPAKASWPREGAAPGEGGYVPQEMPEDAIKRHEAQAAAEQAKLDAQASVAYAKAGNDQQARSDIKARYRQKQKALDDYKRDIAQAKAQQRGDKAASDAIDIERAINK
jgi:hypothetical protein